MVRFFKENPETDLWFQITRILHYHKTEDPKKDHLPWQRRVLVLLVMRKIEEKKQQTDPHGEDKKKKQRKLRMKVRNVYISLWDKRFSNRIHPLE